MTHARRPTLLAIALAGVALGVIVLAWQLPQAYRALPRLAPDSTSYLTWDATRPLAYPLFLRAVAFVSPTLDLLGPVQLGIFLGSAIWLALTLHDVASRPVIAAAIGACTMAHPQVVSYAFAVLPESLLMSLMMAHAAATMRLVARRTTKWAAASAFTLAAAVLLKPAALAFGAGAIVVAGTLWRAPARLRLLAVWAVALAAPIAAASALNVARIGVFSPQAIGGYAMLGVTGTFMPDDTPVEPPELRAALLEEIRPVRDELRRIEPLDMYYFYSSNAYHTVLERSRAVVLDYLGRLDPSASPEALFLRLNGIGQTVARVTIRHAPRQYGRHVLAHLYGLWLMPLVQNAAERDALERRLADVRALAPGLAQGVVMFRFVPAAAYWPYKLLLVVALVCSVVAIGGWIFGGWASVTWGVAAHAAAMLHGYFLLTALAQTGLPRYALAAWPLTMLVVGATAAAAVRLPARTVPAE